MVTLPPAVPRTRADQALSALREVILSGQLAPGTQLREVPLSTDLGMSRGSVREALQRLEEEGLVQRHAFRGSYVAEVSAESLTEIERLRTVLEPYAAVEAMDRLRSGDSRERFVRAVEELEEAARTKDVARCIETHLAVHREIYVATGNQTLIDIWMSWQNQLRFFMALDHRRVGDLDEIAVAHRALLEAIESGDRDAVERELAAHIQPGETLKQLKAL